MIKKLINKTKRKVTLPKIQPANSIGWGSGTDINGFLNVLEEMDKKGVSGLITEIEKEDEKIEENC